MNWTQELQTPCIPCKKGTDFAFCLLCKGYKDYLHYALSRYLFAIGIRTVEDMTKRVEREGVFQVGKEKYTIPLLAVIPGFGERGMRLTFSAFEDIGFDWRQHVSDVPHRRQPFFPLDYLVGHDEPGATYFHNEISKNNLETAGDLANYLAGNIVLNGGNYKVVMWPDAPLESVALALRALSESGYRWWKDVQFRGGEMIEWEYFLTIQNNPPDIVLPPSTLKPRAANEKPHLLDRLPKNSQKRSQKKRRKQAPSPSKQLPINHLLPQISRQQSENQLALRKALEESNEVRKGVISRVVGALARIGIFSVDDLREVERREGREYLQRLLMRQPGFANSGWDVVQAVLDSSEAGSQ